MRERSQRFDPRQNMTAHDFEVFHYLDSRPEPVSVHHHDFYEVYFFLNGQVEYRVEGRIYHLEPGDLLLISPLEFHQPILESSREPYERIVLWINKTYLESFSSGEESLSRCFDSTRPTHTNLLHLTPLQRTSVTARMGELIRETYSTEYGSALCAKGALLQLMVELNRVALQSAGSGERQDEAPALVTQVLRYIGGHFCEDLSLDGLAERFYVSKYHLAHAFQQAVGTSVYRYIILKRLLIAKQMLSGGMSPGIVCHNCGFGDYTNFYRAFKSEYGISPRDYAAQEK